MSSMERLAIWFISFLVFLFILFMGYRISYKLGIKKALYRTTYILLSVIFAFVLSPLVNDELFKIDLRQFNITLTYKEQSFYTLIDYIEEVIAHSDFLNDLYSYFPSLKDLFMDFPEVLLAPVTYVLLFVVFIVVWMPLYLYLSYKRNRRILYDRPDKKSHRVWAGILGSIQCVFIISVILTPVNGVNRLYHASIKDTLDEQYSSLCEENDALKRYSKYCDLIDMYDATIFANIGGEKSINNYVFDSLTRISYDDGYTSISKEASLIIKGSIVLDQSGLVDVAVEAEDSTHLISAIISNDLSDKDINTIINTLSGSKYSEDVLFELGEVAVNTLNTFVQEFIGYKSYNFINNLTLDEIIEEIKVLLGAIKLLSGSNLVAQILDVRQIIVDFDETAYDYKLDDIAIFSFIKDLVNGVDLDEFELLCDYLYQSQIFYRTIPYILDSFFGEFGFEFVLNEDTVLDQFYTFMDFGRLVKKYQPEDFFELMATMNDEDLLLMSELFQYVGTSRETQSFVYFLFSKIFEKIEVYSVSEIFAIKDWQKETYFFRDFCVLMRDYRIKKELDVWGMFNFLKNEDSQLSKIMLNVIQRNLDYFIECFFTEVELL